MNLFKHFINMKISDVNKKTTTPKTSTIFCIPMSLPGVLIATIFKNTDFIKDGNGEHDDMDTSALHQPQELLRQS